MADFEQVEITKGDLLSLYMALSQIIEKVEDASFDFSIAVASTKKSIQQEAEAVQEGILTPFFSKRKALFDEHAEKKDGKPDIQQGQDGKVKFKPVDPTAFQTAFTSLMQEFNTHMMETVKVDVIRIPRAEMPSSGVGPKLVEALLPILIGVERMKVQGGQVTQ